jgi:hypothetical protein
MKNHSIFIGMDVHKNSIDIAIAEQGRKGRVRHYGKIDGTLSALDKLVRKLVSTGKQLHFVYEAGPCGYQIYRHLTALGLDCTVVAPSRIPKPSGNQIKNDRRDALMLARLHRAGELTAVYVPRAEDEAVRDLTRAREDAKSDEKKSKQRLLSFLLRSGIRYTGGSPWSKAHMRWLSDIKAPSIPTDRFARVYRHRESMQRTRSTIDRTDPTPVARMAAFPDRSSTSKHARRFNNCGGHNRCRSWRPETVPYTFRANELPGSGAVGAFQWPKDKTWSHYQDRQWTCTSCPDRGSLVLPTAGPGQSGIAQAAGRPAGIRLRYCVESQQFSVNSSIR